MATVYILFADTLNKFYVGNCEDFNVRRLICSDRCDLKCNEFISNEFIGRIRIYKDVCCSVHYI